MVDENIPLDNDGTVDLNEIVENDPNTEETYFQLSPHAASGHFSLKNLKFKGILDDLYVTVLIGIDNIQNILQPRIAHHLKLPTKLIPYFSVMVGNGSQLNCSSLCPQVPITLQNHLFFISFYLLPIEWANVVLGME